ncbi:MAG: phosphatase PAP2 family protein [Phaeodactylibacter sp.]|nr:phosphatase PAP2 family protein [Phaeodactylibacter sp.]MCB9275906.1 phosphatase PAP2 family protein [Lewinellaceae bacterium]
MMIGHILQLDQQLFHLLNGEWHNAFFDAIMPYWRDKETWFPLYALFGIFLAYRYRLRGLYFILAVVLTVGLADLASSQGFKKHVRRLRPCQDTEIQAGARLLVGCGRSYSFTSSHAANHFAMAAFIALTLGRIYRRIRWPLFLWAASIAYGQVYVGVHYPLDVIAGGLLGVLIGIVVAKVYLRVKAVQLEAVA